MNPITDSFPSIFWDFLGALFLAFYAWNRFNTWAFNWSKDNTLGLAPRYYTTWARYVLWAALYVLLYELALFFMIESPKVFSLLFQSFGLTNSEIVYLEEWNRYSLFGSILIITVIIPNFRLLNKLEENVRGYLQKAAFIPAAAQAMVSNLEINFSAFEPDDDFIRESIEELSTSVFIENDFKTLENTVKHKFCKLWYLKLKLDKWVIRQNAYSFLHSIRGTYDVFDYKAKKLRNEITLYYREFPEEFSNLDAIEPQTSKLRKLYSSTIEGKFHSELDDLLNLVYSFIAVSTLATKKSLVARGNSFRYFGLHLYYPEKVLLQWNSIIFIFLSVFAVAIFTSGFFYLFLALAPGLLTKDLVAKLKIGPYISYAFFVVLLHTAAILTVIVFNVKVLSQSGSKYSRAISYSRIGGENYSILLRGGLFGYFAGFLVSLTLYFIYYYNFLVGAPLLEREMLALSAMPFVSFCTGLFTQYYLILQFNRIKGSFNLILIQSCITAAVAIFPGTLLSKENYFPDWPNLLHAVVINFFIAVAIGYFLNRQRIYSSVESKPISLREKNPYIVGSPISDTSKFFGQKNLVDRILKGIYHNSFYICGERRSGKTSVLRRISHELLNTKFGNSILHPIMIDLQKANKETLFGEVCRGIIKSLAPLKSRIALDEDAEKIDFNGIYGSEGDCANSDDVIDLIDEINMVLSANNEEQVVYVLMIDEFNIMNTFPVETRENLRSLFMYAGNDSVRLIGAGGELDIWDRSSPFNFMIVEKIKPLATEDAVKLIKLPSKDYLEWKDSAVGKIIEITNSEPYRIQQICHVIYDAAIDKGITEIDDKFVTTFAKKFEI